MSKKLIVVCVPFIFAIVWALRVSPASFTAQWVPLGRRKDLGVVFTCSADKKTYLFIARVMPQEEGVPLSVGYRSLPDIGWFIVESGETLRADTSSGIALTKLLVEIPDKPEYYNQHFVVRLFTTGISAGMFQPAMIPYYFLETPPLANPSVSPDGELGVAPSIVELTKSNKNGTFRIYNNDTIEHKYNLVIRKPEERSRRFPNVSSDFLCIDDTAKIVISAQNITLPPKKNALIEVAWKDKKWVNENYEAILLITADDEATNFVRIRIIVDKK
ncbi:MAG: hypothetical protein ACPL6C_04505 [bacterium]